MTSVLEVSQALYGHSDIINYCSFNSKGTYLATASADKTVRIFRIGDSLTSSKFHILSFQEETYNLILR